MPSIHYPLMKNLTGDHTQLRGFNYSPSRLVIKLMAEQHDHVADINGTLCTCGNPVDIIPANGDRFRRQTIYYEVTFYS